MRFLKQFSSVFFLLSIFALTSNFAYAKPKTLIYCIEANPDHFSTAQSTSANTTTASTYTIFNRLVDFKPGTTIVVPSLAEKWEVSEDGLTYTFYLRKGVQFHTTRNFKPTRTLTVDDIIFSYDRQQNPENPFHDVTSSQYGFWDYLKMNNIVEMKKIDDHTLVLRLKIADSAMLSNLAVSAMPIYSKEYADQILASGVDKITFDKKPVGTGPYKIVQYLKNDLVRFKAHKEYFEGPAKIENLIMKVTPDASVRYSKLKSGECHIISNATPADVLSMRNDENIKVLQKTAPNIAYITFNQSKKPFDNVKLRQALAMAINKQEIIEKVFLGDAKAIHLSLPPVLWGYNDKLEPTKFDLEKAKALLVEAGYPNGLEFELWAMPVQRAYMPNGRKVAELIQSSWAKIGVKAEIVTFDWTTYINKAKKFEHEAFMLGWSTDNGHPYNFLGLTTCDGIKGGVNFAHWCNPKYDALLDNALQTTDREESIKNYMEAQEIFLQEMPWIPLTSSKITVAVSKNVEGFVVNPTAIWSFHNVDLVDTE